MSAAERISRFLRDHRDAAIINARARDEILTGAIWTAEHIDELSPKLAAAGLLEKDENGRPHERLPDGTFNNWLYGKKNMSLEIAVVFAEHFGHDFINAIFDVTGNRARPDMPMPSVMLDAYSDAQLLDELRRRAEARETVRPIRKASA